MNYFLKGLLVIAAVATCVALLYFAIALLPVLLIGVFFVVRAVLALGIVVGGVALVIYVPYAIGKAISKK